MTLKRHNFSRIISFIFLCGIILMVRVINASEDFEKPLATQTAQEILDHEEENIHKDQLEKLHNLYSAITRTSYGSPQFHEIYRQFNTFVKSLSLSTLDPQNSEPRLMIWLTDYAYWSLKNGDADEAFWRLTRVADRPIQHDTLFLILGDAAFAYAKTADTQNNRKKIEGISKEAYKQYCYRKLTAQAPIKPTTERKIKTILNIDQLTPQNCFPINNLLQAISEEDTARVTELVAIGADLNITSYYPVSQFHTRIMSSPIYAAIKKNHYEIIDILLQNGADADHVYGEGNGTTGVFIYAYRQLLDNNRHLLSRKAPDNRRLDTQITDLVLKYGGDINAPYLNKSYLLQFAINQPSEIIQYLIDKGADPNFKTVHNNQSPLISAALNGHFDTVKLLVELGNADVNHAVTRAVNIDGKYVCRSPLYHLVSRINSRKTLKPQLDILQYFLLQGADVTAGGAMDQRDCEGVPDQNGWELDLKKATQTSDLPTVQCYMYHSARELDTQKRALLFQECEEIHAAIIPKIYRNP